MTLHTIPPWQTVWSGLLEGQDSSLRTTNHEIIRWFRYSICAKSIPLAALAEKVNHKRGAHACLLLCILESFEGIKCLLLKRVRADCHPPEDFTVASVARGL